MSGKRPRNLGEALPGLWRLLRHLRPYIARSRGLVTGSVIALMAEIGLRLVEPWPLKFAFDRIISSKHHGHGWHIAAVDHLSSTTLFSLAALALVAFTGLRALAGYLNSVGFAIVGSRVLRDARYDLYRHLQCLSLSYHSKARGGDLTLRVMSDLGVLIDATVTAALPLLGNALIMVAMAGFMLWLNLRLGLIALAAVPLFWLITLHRARLIFAVSRRQRQREGAMAATAAETIGAIKFVQAFSLGDRFASSFSEDNAQTFTESVKASRLAGSLGRALDVMVALISAVVLWFGARAAKGGAISAGDLVIFLAYLRNAFRPLKDLAKYSTRLARAVVAGERAMSVLDQEPAVRDLPGALPAPPLRGSVTFRHVHFGYETGHTVLNDVSFQAGAGQQVALLGRSGSGKSTLISLILRLYDVGEGAIMIDDRDLREYTIASLRGQISMVLQDSLLFAATIRDNIAYGTTNATEREIEAAARLANAHRFIEAMPDGYDTLVGERGTTLSGGQRQRIAIARAAIRKAPLLLLDEPTAGLDRENSHAVIEALKRLARGCTTFIATHDLQIAATADLILYFEDGRVVERGTHAELIRQRGPYATMLKRHPAAV